MAMADLFLETVNSDWMRMDQPKNILQPSFTDRSRWGCGLDRRKAYAEDSRKFQLEKSVQISQMCGNHTQKL